MVCGTATGGTPDTGIWILLMVEFKTSLLGKLILSDFMKQILETDISLSKKSV